MEDKNVRPKASQKKYKSLEIRTILSIQGTTKAAIQEHNNSSKKHRNKIWWEASEFTPMESVQSLSKSISLCEIDNIQRSRKPQQATSGMNVLGLQPRAGFNDYMELKYRISIPKEPLIEFAKEVYRLGFSEPHTSDEQPCRNSGVFDGTCNADMNEWGY